MHLFHSLPASNCQCWLDHHNLWILFFLFSPDRVTLLASSVGVDSGSGSASGTPFPKAKVWQVTQKQKTVDDLVSVVINCQCQSLTSVFLRNRDDVIYGQKKCES